MTDGETSPTPNATDEAVAASASSSPEGSAASASQPPSADPSSNPPVNPSSDPSANQASDSSNAAKPKRPAGPLAARGLGIAKPASPSVDASKLGGNKPTGQSADGGSSKSGSSQSDPSKSHSSGGGDGKPVRGNKKSRSAPRPKLAGDRRGPKPDTPVRDAAAVANAGSAGDAAAAGVTEAASADTATSDSNQGGENKKPPRRSSRPQKVAVPSLREDLDDELQAELDAAFAEGGQQIVESAVDMIPRRGEPIIDGARVHAIVLKIHDGNVFVALGGPDEGMVPFEQFESEPNPGDSIEVVARGTTPDGLYQCSLPGGAIEVSDWDDLQEGAVVEAVVTATNAGGLEAKVGAVAGFIPISQISEYRVEDTAEFVDQKFLCVVTEANPRRRNLVLSRRAILEREREEKKKEQLAKIEPGDEIEGVVRKVMDFGAFVDLGALDGLIHVSKLSWERIKHPSEVLEEGQKVKVRIDKVDKETGKIGLSYRDLLENPWDTAESQFAPGSVHSGTVTKVAPFGCFVRLTAGVEGMVHISELANHRVSKVDAFVSEGDAVDVKVLTFDRDAQKISLSIKQANKSGPPEVRKTEDDGPAPEVSIKPQHAGPLKGGNNRDTGGEKFGLRW